MSPTDGEPAEETVAKFTQVYKRDWDKALREIRAGQKRSCWSWYIWPTLYRQGASGMSATYALTEESTAAFLADDYLRGCYTKMMDAVASQLEAGVTPQKLCGIDKPRVPASCELFERVSATAGDSEVSATCARVLRALHSPPPKKKLKTTAAATAVEPSSQQTSASMRSAARASAMTTTAERDTATAATTTTTTVKHPDGTAVVVKSSSGGTKTTVKHPDGAGMTVFTEEITTKANGNNNE